MSNALRHISPAIRRLWSSDQQRLAAHFHRLDPASRRLRFFAASSDTSVARYAETLLDGETVVFGAFPDGELRGIAELRGLAGHPPRNAELALSVEPDWQHLGIGEALMNRLIAAAQNRGVRTLHMMCLRENRTMQALARKHHAELTIAPDAVEGSLRPHWPTPLSLFEEMSGDPRNYLHALFHPSL